MLVRADQQFKATKSWPKLRISEVKTPAKGSDPLSLSVELSATTHDTLVAISQEQLTVSIATKDEPFLFEGTAIFAKDTPKIFTVSAGKPITLSFQTNSDKNREAIKWRSLAKGEYKLRVVIHSGKMREFDYQWLGIVSSDEYKLTIK
jgi:hypothetical protein